ncbi:SGNH/GDSL hydrolase family protein [bacterium]|nr:SGNH/GDSL hydrolase family protein [bacterium]
MLHQLASVVLGPLLLAQGRSVHHTVTKLPEAAGPRAGTAGEGPDLRLLIVGDSAGAGVGAATQQEALSGRIVAQLASSFTVQWRVIARTGATTAGTIKHLGKVEAQPFDFAVTSLGVNDVSAGRSVRAWIDEQAALIDLLHTKFNVKHVMLSALPPVHLFPALPQPLRWYLGAQAKRYNRALAAWASPREDCTFVTLNYPMDVTILAEDLFHPGPEVYRLWAQAVAEAIGQRRD